MMTACFQVLLHTLESISKDLYDQSTLGVQVLSLTHHRHAEAYIDCAAHVRNTFMMYSVQRYYDLLSMVLLEQLTLDVQMTSLRLIFIQLSQLTRWPLYVSPFFNSTSWGNTHI